MIREFLSQEPIEKSIFYFCVGVSASVFFAMKWVTWVLWISLPSGNYYRSKSHKFEKSNCQNNVWFSRYWVFIKVAITQKNSAKIKNRSVIRKFRQSFYMLTKTPFSILSFDGVFRMLKNVDTQELNMRFRLHYEVNCLYLTISQINVR